MKVKLVKYEEISIVACVSSDDAQKIAGNLTLEGWKVTTALPRGGWVDKKEKKGEWRFELIMEKEVEVLI